MSDAKRQREERIRQRAYALWEQAGRPHGQDEAHWHQARSELDATAEQGAALDAQLADTFPASDPPSLTDPNRGAGAAAKPARAAKPPAPPAKAGKAAAPSSATQKAAAAVATKAPGAQPPVPADAKPASGRPAAPKPARKPKA
ncbi:DUF2934 domain-containing protein [Pseudoroseomonas cervicalis]|uniref:DUF2934 domain-containing protein n=1 Tax=Teichococcus cervicalis TaxID=204525 RepID=UPI0022F198DF|nr:DUF2934 domain-containing protein [Pseudoroseomonas cervicalis]WBV43323.1 DUF2934 domain-containing protein [Pseudoroseomonas cervicalis]